MPNSVDVYVAIFHGLEKESTYKYVIGVFTEKERAMRATINYLNLIGQDELHLDILEYPYGATIFEKHTPWRSLATVDKADMYL